jgi:D-alanyl-D-alanine carboxypeptidase
MGSMLHPAAPVPSPSIARRVAFVAVGATLAASIAALIALLASGPLVTALAPAGAPVVPAVVPFVPDAPNVEHGMIPAGEAASLADEHLPAIARLDPALRDAMRQAEADAATDGLAFEVTSGWRSAEYQEWLLEDAIEFYGSEIVARQYVATPEKSTHVTGDGIDIGPIDAQFWLIEHGAQYGICQTYANERWHFELATEPGEVCPEMKTDAAS